MLHEKHYLSKKSYFDYGIIIPGFDFTNNSEDFKISIFQIKILKKILNLQKHMSTWNLFVKSLPR